MQNANTTSTTPEHVCQRHRIGGFGTIAISLHTTNRGVRTADIPIAFLCQKVGVPLHSEIKTGFRSKKRD